MSMSQEEIEALMNGLDIEDDVEAEDETVAVNTQEIEELLSQTEGLKEDIKFDNEKTKENEVEFKPNTTSVSSSDIEKLLSEIENVSENTSSTIVSSPKSEKVVEPEKEIVVEKILGRSEDEIVNDWTNSKIKEGVFPLPAEKDTKVVNQLSQVANDSEEKVSQIFDVLSLTLDNNNELRNHVKDFESYFSTQASLLSSLNSKFPNIKVFNEHLSNTNKAVESLKSIKNLINSEDSEIFQAMELMQFNDINRQKIERVMSVIRKLSLYLNNLFEDDGATKEVAIAKHIHGDSTDDLIGDDLDKLIAEFSHDK